MSYVTAWLGVAKSESSHRRATTRRVLRLFEHSVILFDRLYQSTGQYIKRLFPGTEPRQFDGPLCGYLDFLHPVLLAMRALPFMPEGPVYLLMDDADTLSSDADKGVEFLGRHSYESRREY